MAHASNTQSSINVIAVENTDTAQSDLCRRLITLGGFGVGHAADWDQLEAELSDGRYDVVVIHGAGSGNESAFEINEKVKSLANNPAATILYGGQDTVSAARKAFRCGFAEFLPLEKATDQELAKAIQHAAHVSADQRQQGERIRFLEKASQYDGSTGLPNRHYLDDRIQQLIAIARRYNKGFVLVLLHVNEVKDVMARFGGRLAEKVFYSCAVGLRQTARNSDIFGRFDNDTFFYLVDNFGSRQDIDAVRRRLVESLTCSLNIDELSITLSADTTVAHFPADGENAEELIASALAALMQLIAEAGGEFREATVVDNGHRDAFGHETSSNAGEGGDASPEAVLRAENRRAFQRRRVFKRGAIIFNNGYSKVDCTIKDISDGGARIATDARFVMPEHLELLIVETGQRYRAEKRWQADRMTGLMFLH